MAFVTLNAFFSVRMVALIYIVCINYWICLVYQRKVALFTVDMNRNFNGFFTSDTTLRRITKTANLHKNAKNAKSGAHFHFWLRQKWKCQHNTINVLVSVVFCQLFSFFDYNTVFVCVSNFTTLYFLLQKKQFLSRKSWKKLTNTVHFS